MNIPISILTKKGILPLLALTALFTGCKEDLPDRLYIADEQQQISAYIENNAETSMTAELLHRSGYFHLLNSYGRYTLFAPTNDAWGRYLSGLGKSEIAQLSDEECLELFDFHALRNGVDLKAQRTGLLSASDTTMSGMRHYVDLTGGFSNMVMNKTSKVEASLELPNGFLYIVSEAFAPRHVNIYDYLKTGGYSIFADAIEAVGMKDTLQQRMLNYPNSIYYYHPKWTVFATPDAVFQRDGVNSADDLKNKVWELSQSDGYNSDANAEEALREFVRYHILHLWQGMSAYWRNERLTPLMFRKENMRTYAHNKSRYISFAASADPVYPDPVINGRVKLNRDKSDVSFLNGVVHELTEIMYINKNPQLTTYIFECEEAIDWKVDFYSITGNMASVNFGPLYLDIAFDERRGVVNMQSATGYSASAWHIYGVGYGLWLQPLERGMWVDFYLRNVPAGKYDVYLNYRRTGSNSQNVNAYFRKAGEEYDFVTQRLNSETLNLRADRRSINNIEVLVFEFGQNLLLGRITKKNEDMETEEPIDDGDYVIRFVHSDRDPAYYDNIILVPIEE